MNVTDEMKSAAEEVMSAVADLDGLELAEYWMDRAQKAEAALAAMPQPVAVDTLFAAARIGWTRGREAWCPASILDDADRTERDWMRHSEEFAASIASLTTPAQGAQPSEEDDLKAAREVEAKRLERIGLHADALNVRLGRHDFDDDVQYALSEIRATRRRDTIRAESKRAGSVE